MEYLSPVFPDFYLVVLYLYQIEVILKKLKP